MNICRKCMKMFVDKRTHVCPSPEEQKDTKDLSKSTGHNSPTDGPIQHK
jgi:hypothetical protein